MLATLDDLLTQQAQRTPDSPALYFKDKSYCYQTLDNAVTKAAIEFSNAGIQPNERIAIYLPKVPEAIFALFGASRAGAVFVPINPLLKPAQVSYILKDCNVRILITSSDRLLQLKDELERCHDVRDIWVTNDKPTLTISHIQVHQWPDSITTPFSSHNKVRRIDRDLAAILYTSGSTGNPKGVVLTHRNMLAGADSVSTYLENTPKDILLAVLPLSFDYGLSQLTTAFLVGASVVLMDYLLPRDVIKAVSRYSVTGLAGVPPLWNQLAQLEWPDEAVSSLRYITNSGGAMPVTTTQQFREKLPSTDIYLMYGLTEAFRSTYLPPNQVDIRPTSMGKAIPNAEVLILREDGTECAPGEPGELVHRGPLVSSGYWNDPEKTSIRFRPLLKSKELPLPEIAVWSGDRVKKDEEGYFYFVSRNDEMIKTSGYRVSPTEVEEVVYASGLVREAVALGAKHPDLGEAILLVAIVIDNTDANMLMRYFQQKLPGYMQPKHYLFIDELPRNQNGKIDRKTLSDLHKDIFMEQRS